MKNLFIILQLVLLTACKKDVVNIPGITPDPVTASATSEFTTYSIAKGSHHADKSKLRAFSGSRISFKVKFDSTAIYQTTDPANQYDINKLYGFSEGVNNHLHSARIGWSWSDNALRLYAYAYAAGIRSSKEICIARIGATLHAEISISGKEYRFSIDGKEVSLPRALNDSTVSGYWQYPYFGGDELAPHNIYISIHDL